MNQSLRLETEEDSVSLREMELSASTAYFGLIAANRTWLHQFGNTTGESYTTVQDVNLAVEAYTVRDDTEAERWFTIWNRECLVGAIDFRPYRDGWEIGYWLGEEYTGNGYATLAVKAIANHAQEHRKRLYAVVRKAHNASIAVLLRANFISHGEENECAYYKLEPNSKESLE